MQLMTQEDIDNLHEDIKAVAQEIANEGYQLVSATEADGGMVVAYVGLTDEPTLLDHYHRIFERLASKGVYFSNDLNDSNRPLVEVYMNPAQVMARVIVTNVLSANLVS